VGESDIAHPDSPTDLCDSTLIIVRRGKEDPRSFQPRGGDETTSTSYDWKYLNLRMVVQHTAVFVRGKVEQYVPLRIVKLSLFYTPSA
jgi:hypothetical protein